MNDLREVAPPGGRFDVKFVFHPTPQILEAPDWVQVKKNLLARFRVVYLDSEECSFRKIGPSPSAAFRAS